MNEFLYLFRGGNAERGAFSPEQMQAQMARWQSWMGQLAEEGKLHSPGAPLQAAGKVVAKGGVITDGPFTEGKEIVGGYIIVKAKDINDAATISKGCPIFEVGGTVEIREIAPM